MASLRRLFVPRLRGVSASEPKPAPPPEHVTSPVTSPRSNDSDPGSVRRRTLSISASVQGITLAYEDAIMTGSASSPIPLSSRRQRASSICGSDEHRSELMRMLASQPRHAPCMPMPESTAHKLLDSFSVCGASVLDGPPTTLVSIPAGADVPNVAAFCFPDCPPPCIPLSATPPIERIDRFMFCMTTLKESTGAIVPLYAFVMRHYEVLEEPADWIPFTAVQRGSMLSQRHFTLRAYCIVSHNPYARLFWQMLETMLHTEKRRMLSTEEKDRHRYQGRALCFSKMIADLSTRSFAPGVTMRLENPACFGHAGLRFDVPNAAQSLRQSVAAVCFPVLLRAMSPRNIIALVCAVLSESKIVVVGHRPDRVSACVMALMTSIAPFPWQGVYLPLVPHSLIDMLDAPVPLIAGYVTDDAALDLDTTTRPGDRLVIAYVDLNQIKVFGETLPALPHADVLVGELRAPHQWLRGTCLVSNGMCQDDDPFVVPDASAVAQIYSAMAELNHYMMWVINHIRKLLPEHKYAHLDDIIDVRHQATVLMRVLPAHSAFVEALLTATHYQSLAVTFDVIPAPTDAEVGIYADLEL